MQCGRFMRKIKEEMSASLWLQHTNSALVLPGQSGINDGLTAGVSYIHCVLTLLELHLHRLASPLEGAACWSEVMVHHNLQMKWNASWDLCVFSGKAQKSGVFLSALFSLAQWSLVTHDKEKKSSGKYVLCESLSVLSVSVCAQRPRVLVCVAMLGGWEALIHAHVTYFWC